MKNGQLISVLGSPNSDKTTFTCQIAKYLASKNKNVLVLFSDYIIPPLSFIAEKNELEELKSISKLFSSSEINKNTIKSTITLIKNSDYLAFLGLVNRENEFSYPKLLDETVNKIYSNSKELFDFIILDTSNNIPQNKLDIIGLAQSNIIFKLNEQSLKSIAFYQSFESISKNFILSNIKVVNILNNYRKEYELHSMFNGINYFLPYCDEVKNQLEYGKMLKKLTSKNGEKYKNEVKRIIDEVLL